jgi:hypothetical protein
MKKRIVLAGMPNQRDMDALQSLIEGKDQRFRSVYIIPIDNPITGQRKIYVEKRPGFEAANIGDCLGVVSEGCIATAIHYSNATGKYITAFCGHDAFVNCTSVGSTAPDPESEFVCLPIFQCEFDGNSEADVSGNDMDATIAGSTLPTISGGYISFPWINSGIGTPATVTYGGGSGEIDNHNADDFTMEFYVNVGSGGSGSSDHALFRIGGTSADSRIFVIRNSASSDYLKIYYRDGTFGVTGNVAASSALTVDTWTHVAVCVSPATGDRTVSIYYDGVRVANVTERDYSPLPSASGGIILGGPQSGASTNPVLMDDVRLSPCLVYTGESFTPPARGSLPNP